MPFSHLISIPGHPMEADLDCSALDFAAKFAVTGDFDNDKREELAIAPDAGGSAGNDFWVMKFDLAAGAWPHLSPIAGHPMEADLDCSVLDFPAKFAVAGNFDNDGQDELAVAPDAGQSAGNDFWVMKFDPVARAWSHLSPIAGHPMEADLDRSVLDFPAKFAVAGDFDHDGQDELPVAPDAGQSAGNDFWVMKFDPATRRWSHLSPIAGHPMDADLDCSGLDFPAKFAVVGDFDHDGQDELAIAPDAGGSAGNDFWVMKFDPATRRWSHLSPIAGHPMEADLDCSILGFPAKFAVAGDFDNDRQDELAIAPDAGQSAGNDFWVMKFNPAARAWSHLSPIAGHPMEADLDCSILDFPAKFAVAGDFDNDRQDELAIAPDAGGSAGNDFWVMKFDPAARTWSHRSPIAGHPVEADLDCSVLAFPANFAVAGAFSNANWDSIAVAPSARGTEGNDLWVMEFAEESPDLRVTFIGTATSITGDTRFPGPFTNPLNLTLTFSRDRRAVRLDTFPDITVGPFSTPIGMNTITISQLPRPAGGGSGVFVPDTGAMMMPISLHFHHSLAFAGDSDVAFGLTTGNSTSPRGTFSPTGSVRNRATGMIILVAASTFTDGFLGGTECSLTIAGTFSPIP